MSKCWYCNNELTIGDSPKHFGICNKCYDEMFKSGDTIIRSLTNKIADLEAKLAESENGEKMLVDDICELDEQIKNYEKEIAELKQQLAEKEKSLSIKSVVRTLMKDNDLNCTFRDKTNAQIQQCGDVYNSNYGYFNFEDDYDESLNNKNDNRFDITSIDLTNQDKISFCIEQLEQMKELLNTDFESIISWIDPYEDGECLTSMTYNHNNTIKIIDNQIKAIKGEK